MRIDFVLLVAAYVLSQFFRSFLPVLTGALERDVGADAADLSNAAGVWFLAFAAMQLPVGWAGLARAGRRRFCWAWAAAAGRCCSGWRRLRGISWSAWG